MAQTQGIRGSSAWWTTGVRWECQMSGKCCHSRGETGSVYLTLADRRHLAKHLGLPTREFTRRHCEKVTGVFRLKESPERIDCVFLEDNRCGVYEARPTQCRTWPFWPENMNAKAWKRDVAGFCPGVGKGRLIPAEEIRGQMAVQRRSDGNL